MLLVTINDVELLEMQKHRSVSMREHGRCRFSTQDLKIGSLRFIDYRYEHMGSLRVMMSYAH
jgi:hypothetical protein